MNRVFVTSVGILIAFGAFWFLDFPQTVRLKAAIVRSLPLAPKTTNSTIRSLCQGARPNDSADCYLSFRSEEAEAAVQCRNLADQLSRSKDWIKIDESGHFAYNGADPEIRKLDTLFYFYPEHCVFVGDGPNGKTNTYNLAAKRLFNLD